MTGYAFSAMAERGLPVPDSDYLDDDELAVELEVDGELAFEQDDFPLRLVEGEDDRFARGVHDAGTYAAEELAMHML